MTLQEKQTAILYFTLDPSSWEKNVNQFILGLHWKMVEGPIGIPSGARFGQRTTSWVSLIWYFICMLYVVQSKNLFWSLYGYIGIIPFSTVSVSLSVENVTDTNKKSGDRQYFSDLHSGLYWCWIHKNAVDTWYFLSCVSGVMVTHMEIVSYFLKGVWCNYFPSLELIG